MLGVFCLDTHVLEVRLRTPSGVDVIGRRLSDRQATDDVIPVAISVDAYPGADWNNKVY